jgi:ribose transport system ATP-binding protein
MIEKDTIVKSKKVFMSMQEISKHFGGIKALIDGQLQCMRGETHVLIGQNGAGKSTLVKIISGIVNSDTGVIKINGETVKINNTADATKYKIASVFQELSLIEDLSVAENIFLGNELTNTFGQVSFKNMYKEAESFLKEINMDLNPRFLVRDLNLCQKQMLEIAKALYKEPEILILDEATSALGANEVKWLFNKIKEMTKKENKAVIFISHRMNELNQVADRATIFRDARFLITFEWGKLTNDEIISYISGKERQNNNIKKNIPKSDKITLELKDVSKGHVLKNINIQLKEGEILGIAGLSGHGQVELLHNLYGDGTFDTGSIYVYGKKVKIKNQRDALKNGIVLVPEDRKNEGLILKRSIKENITMMSLNQIQKFGKIIRKKEQEKIDESVGNLSIKAPNVELEVESLSGGNQQKVLISKALSTNSKIILLSDPTRGIDVGTKNEIYQLMLRLAKEGFSIIFFSTETSEIISICNRVLIFYEGKARVELIGDEITEENIVAGSIGIDRLPI